MKEADKTVTRKHKVISVNKKAYHDYEILDKYEAGIQLQGTEVKSLRNMKASISESYGKVKNGEVWLYNVNIPEYKHGNISNHQPKRNRKLLLKKNEIRKLQQKLNDKSMTLIPLKIYFSGPYAKLEIGLARGKKIYDKRESMKSAEIKRKLNRIKI
jgi:SsrA-binding protein